ncbi:MAG: hypothetical protein KAI45_04390, partial [Melioribacteraceae bacterium]|nr:hypothetical protein [Melioribacteraceae bacterium]
ESDGEYDIEKELKLKSGNYEVYFSAGSKNDKYFNLNMGAIQGLISGHKSDLKEFKEEYFINVSGKVGAFQQSKPFELVNE